MVRVTPIRLRALALACGALALLLGAGCAAARNDPGTRGALVVGADLAFVESSAFVRGEGRLWLRLMPESGAAFERELPWVLERAPDAPPLSSEEPPRPVAFRHDRAGLPPGVALFDDLAPGAYRISSFLVSARLEKKDGTTSLASISGETDGLGPVRVEAGEMLDLGLLSMSLSPLRHYDYRAAHDGKDRAALARSAREDVRAFRTALATIPARGDAAPALAQAPHAASAPGSGAGIGSQDPVQRGRVRPRGIAGEPRAEPEGPAPVNPSQGGPTAGDVIAALAADRSAVEVGLSLSAGEAFSDADQGAGVIRIELRRIGRSADVAAIEAGFDLGAPSTVTARRAVDLVAAGAARLGGGAVVAWTRLEPGEWEVSSIRATGTFTRGAAERRISAEADASRFGSVRVLAGELADMGALQLDLGARDRLAVRYDARGAEARIAALREAGASGPGTRPDPILRGLRPVVRPIGPASSGGQD